MREEREEEEGEREGGEKGREWERVGGREVGCWSCLTLRSLSAVLLANDM